MPIFNGDNLIITLDAGVILVDAQQQLYKPWKNFVREISGGQRNSRFPPAFDTIGGDDLTPGIEAGAYFFLRNDLGWRIRPPEEDITITFTGNLVPRDSTLPIVIPTTGAFTVLINGLQPITQGADEILRRLKIVEAFEAGSVNITGTGPFVLSILDPDDGITEIATMQISTDGLTRLRLT